MSLPSLLGFDSFCGNGGYPADTDVRDLVAGSGLMMPAGFTFGGSTAYAIREWENATGRTPFLVDTVDVPRTYDPPGATSKSQDAYYLGGERKLELDAGLVSCTSVLLGVTPDNVGQSMDLARQLRFMPANAPAEGKPWEWIEFYFPVYGSPSSIVVTGKWGYCTTVPADAYQAVLRLAVALCLDSLAFEATTGVIIQREGDETSQFSPEMLKAGSQVLRGFAARIANRYRLIRLGA